MAAAVGANAYAFAGNNPLNAAAPEVSPGLYAGAGVYEAAKAGGEKKGRGRARKKDTGKEKIIRSMNGNPKAAE